MHPDCDCTSCLGCGCPCHRTEPLADEALDAYWVDEPTGRSFDGDYERSAA